MKSLFNWSEASRLMCGCRTRITDNYSGKMYKQKVNRIKRIEKSLRKYLELDRNIDESFLDDERTELLKKTLKDIIDEII